MEVCERGHPKCSPTVGGECTVPERFRDSELAALLTIVDKIDLHMMDTSAVFTPDDMAELSDQATGKSFRRWLRLRRHPE